MIQKDAADLLGVSIRSLQRLVQQGKLTATYERGKTRSVPVFDRNEIEALRVETCNRPVYSQKRVRGEHARKPTFGFRAAPEEIQRLSGEAARFGMRPSEYARHLVQLGLESGFRKEADRLSKEIASLQTQIASLTELLRVLRKDVEDTTEIVLEFSGLSADEARCWVDENLRLLDQRRSTALAVRGKKGQEQ